ncbi:hypothetical protein RHS01_04496 [Rhizoctonia solani]|uniref:Uncharacterized protein n=1 Tax=Rhizoctonia solani TaxID=456999 RepID=A0A8H7IG95_9AGAM|nr:hypothetical protein RHS01_04496 [Rhizoctonia solani]
MLFSTALLAASAALAFASPLEPRAAPDNTLLTVHITNRLSNHASSCPHEYWRLESEGQMQSYCSTSAHSHDSQGYLPDDFWTKVTYKKGKGKGDWVQLTGCIKKGFSQLNDNDGGGQYDSSGGDGGAGNPRGSKCKNYNHYVEIVEPDVGRACIRCCKEYSDCPLDKDTAGCPAVVPGTYC